jgi:protein-L-isoaspartate O-methyltransferase
LASSAAAWFRRDLRGRGIKDESVLAATGAIPRHLFVPEERRLSASLTHSTDCSVHYSAPLWRQFQERGHLVMLLGESERDQKLIRARKAAGKPIIEEFHAVLFVPLTGAIRKQDR